MRLEIDVYSLRDRVMEAQRFKEQFDENRYVILRNFIPLGIMNNIQLTIERIIDELAEERVGTGKIPYTFYDEPFNIRLKRIYENEPESAPLQFTAELHHPKLHNLPFSRE